MKDEFYAHSREGKPREEWHQCLPSIQQSPPARGRGRHWLSDRIRQELNLAEYIYERQDSNPRWGLSAGSQDEFIAANVAPDSLYSRVRIKIGTFLISQQTPRKFRDILASVGRKRVSSPESKPS